MRKSRITICMLIVCTMIMSLFAAEVFAAGTFDPSAKATLTIQAKYGSEDPEPVTAMSFRIYRIAEIEAGPKFKMTEEFKDCGVTVKGDSAAEWDGIAGLIKGYAQVRKLEPAFTISSDGNGLVKIESIDTGLYLVVGERTVNGEYTYEVKPGIVSVPGNADGDWNYDVTMVPKLEREHTPVDIPGTQKKTVDRKALKIWDDDGNEEKRPEDITVSLLCNGEVYAAETLNEENGWSCEWRGLAALDTRGNEYEWNLIEDAVEGYSASMEQSGITFVLTNTYVEELPEDPTPLGPATPGNPGKSGEPGEPLEELPEDPVPLAMIPQTGMLWWPVPVLAFLGFVFLYAGSAIRRRENA